MPRIVLNRPDGTRLMRQPQAKAIERLVRYLRAEPLVSGTLEEHAESAQQVARESVRFLAGKLGQVLQAPAGIEPGQATRLQDVAEFVRERVCVRVCVQRPPAILAIGQQFADTLLQ